MMFKTLLLTFAHPLAKMHTNTLVETLSYVERIALLDTLADTLVEVKTIRLLKNWVMYRPKNRSTRRLTH